jgi:hypothetical protein
MVPRRLPSLRSKRRWKLGQEARIWSPPARPPTEPTWYLLATNTTVVMLNVFFTPRMQEATCRANPTKLDTEILMEMSSPAMLKSNVIDAHNHARQSVLALEKSWVTQDCLVPSYHNDHWLYDHGRLEGSPPWCWEHASTEAHRHKGLCRGCYQGNLNKKIIFGRSILSQQRISRFFTPQSAVIRRV